MSLGFCALALPLLPPAPPCSPCACPNFHRITDNVPQESVVRLQFNPGIAPCWLAVTKATSPQAPCPKISPASLNIAHWAAGDAYSQATSSCALARSSGRAFAAGAASTGLGSLQAHDTHAVSENYGAQGALLPAHHCYRQAQGGCCLGATDYRVSRLAGVVGASFGS